MIRCFDFYYDPTDPQKPCYLVSRSEVNSIIDLPEGYQLLPYGHKYLGNQLVFLGEAAALFEGASVNEPMYYPFDDADSTSSTGIAMYRLVPPNKQSETLIVRLNDIDAIVSLPSFSYRVSKGIFINGGRIRFLGTAADLWKVGPPTSDFHLPKPLMVGSFSKRNYYTYRWPRRQSLLRSYLRNASISFTENFPVLSQLPCVPNCLAELCIGHPISIDQIKLLRHVFLSLHISLKTFYHIVRGAILYPHLYKEAVNDIISQFNASSASKSNSIAFQPPSEVCPILSSWCELDRCDYYIGRDISTFERIITTKRVNADRFKAEARDEFSDVATKLIASPQSGISCIHASISSGKTYFISETTIRLARYNNRVIVAIPNHRVGEQFIAYIKSHVSKGLLLPTGKPLVQVFGKRDETCNDSKGSREPQSSCKYCDLDIVNIKENRKKDLLNTCLDSNNNVFGFEELRNIVDGINSSNNSDSICVRTLSHILAQHSCIALYPFIFIINPSLHRYLIDKPDYIFIEEADAFIDALLNHALAKYDLTFYYRDGQLKKNTLIYYYLSPDDKPLQRYRNKSEMWSNNIWNSYNDFKKNNNLKHTIREHKLRDIVTNVEKLIQPSNKHIGRSAESDVHVDALMKKLIDQPCVDKQNIGWIRRPIIRRTSNRLPKYLFLSSKRRNPCEEFIFPQLKCRNIFARKVRLNKINDGVRCDWFPLLSDVAKRKAYASQWNPSLGERDILELAAFSLIAQDSGAVLIPKTQQLGYKNECSLSLQTLNRRAIRDVSKYLKKSKSILFSGTFQSQETVAASLLEDVDAIRYHSIKTKLHDSVIFILHNNQLASKAFNIATKGNPYIAKNLGTDAPYMLYKEIKKRTRGKKSVQMLAWYSNKKYADQAYNSVKVAGKVEPIRVADSEEQQRLNEWDWRLHSQSRKNEDDCIYFMHLRAAQARGINLPNYNIAVVVGSGRPQYDPYVPITYGINRNNDLKISKECLINDNRNREVFQAVTRIPRDSIMQRVVVIINDMTISDLPEYARDRAVYSNDLFDRSIVPRPKDDESIADWQLHVLAEQIVNWMKRQFKGEQVTLARGGGGGRGR